MPKRKRLRTGFTLIEMLIALAVFAVLGVLSQQLLSQILEAHRVTTERGQRLTDLDRAMQILQRDFLQLDGRGVRDQLGGFLPYLQLGKEDLIEFTRTGWSNPLQRPRSELQRVAYVLEEDTLYRYYWPLLDRSPDALPRIQELLSDVNQVEFLAIDSAGEEHPFWPDSRSEDTTLGAIALRIDLKPFGEINRLWLVPNPAGTEPRP